MALIIRLRWQLVFMRDGDVVFLSMERTQSESTTSDTLSLLEDLRLLSRLLSYLFYTTVMELAGDKAFKETCRHETCRHKPLLCPL